MEKRRGEKKIKRTSTTVQRKKKKKEREKLATCQSVLIKVEMAIIVKSRGKD
jgi:hypothetical protein